MGAYSVDGSQTVAATPDTTLGIAADGTTPRRQKIVEFSVGARAVPADNALLHTVQRFTAQGTGTAVTPQALDPADAAALADALENHTAEPTYTANAILWQIALNQRATYRWVAAPGKEFVIPATANNGLGWFTSQGTSSFTADVDAHAIFEEQ